MAKRLKSAGLAAVLLISACGNTTPAPEPLETPEVTAAPPTVTPTSTATPTPTETNGSAVTPDIPTGFEQWYHQTIEWQPTQRGFEHATIEAPLSWHDPTLGSITLALIRHPATGARIGSILLNPGGPGEPGVGFVDAIYTQLGVPLRSAFDVVGFDPRGVGQSTPIFCMDDAGKDAFVSADFTDDDAGRAHMAAVSAAWGQACYENTGELLANVDTMSAARDMDLIRHLVGDETLNYLGFSYGTQLGATYAGLFPERVGRMVLDGAIDTTLNSDELSLGQAIGFEQALQSYVADCQTRAGCPLHGTVAEGMAQISDLLVQAQANPLPTSSGRTLNRTLAFYGIALPLYDHASWTFLSMGLREALEQGTGEILLSLADFYNDRNADGTFASNSLEAFRAIGCVDDRSTSDPVQMAALADELMAAAPTMGTFFTFGGLVCRDWPVPVAPGSFDLHAVGAPPILVIGTTGDPATPYAWSVGLADTLDSGVLLTFEGEGHTAYTRSNNCVMDTVDDFLVNGVVPPDGKTC